MSRGLFRKRGVFEMDPGALLFEAQKNTTTLTPNATWADLTGWTETIAPGPGASFDTGTGVLTVNFDGIIAVTISAIGTSTLGVRRLLNGNVDLGRQVGRSIMRVSPGDEIKFQVQDLALVPLGIGEGEAVWTANSL